MSFLTDEEQLHQASLDFTRIERIIAEFSEAIEQPERLREFLALKRRTLG